MFSYILRNTFSMDAKKCQQGSGWGGQGGCERRTVFFLGGGEGGVGLGGGGSQGGCESGIEVFVKIQKKRIFFLGGGGGR